MPICHCQTATSRRRRRHFSAGGPFAAAWRTWLDSQPQWRGETRTQYARSLRFFTEVAGPRAVGSVTEDHILAFAAARRDGEIGGRPASIATIRKDLRHLHAFFADVLTMADNPVGRQVGKKWRPFTGQPSVDFHTYTLDEVRTLIDAAKDLASPARWGLLLYLLFSTGLRLTEALHLLWRDVDVDQATLIVRPRHNVDGVVDWEPKRLKTSGVTQAVLLPLDSYALSLIERQRDEQPAAIPYLILTGPEYARVRARPMFYTRQPRRIAGNLWDQFKRLKRLAGVEAGTFHDFRKTFVVASLSGGAHVGEVTAITRQTPATVMSYYARVENARAVDKIRAINAQRLNQGEPNHAMGRSQLTGG